MARLARGTIVVTNLLYPLLENRVTPALSTCRASGNCGAQYEFYRSHTFAIYSGRMTLRNRFKTLTTFSHSMTFLLTRVYESALVISKTGGMSHRRRQCCATIEGDQSGHYSRKENQNHENNGNNHRPISSYGEARSTVKGSPLSAEELKNIDAYWRASL